MALSRCEVTDGSDCYDYDTGLDLDVHLSSLSLFSLQYLNGLKTFNSMSLSLSLSVGVHCSAAVFLLFIMMLHLSGR
ncbi:hypothetical protein MHYP_G00180730 [Metynnis hypsauchen]